MRVWSMPGVAGEYSEIASLAEGAGGLGVALCAAGALALVVGLLLLAMMRKRHDARLRPLEAAATHANEAIAVLDPAGAIEWVNPAFARLTGYDRACVAGRDALGVLCGRETSSAGRAVLETSIRCGTPCDLTLQLTPTMEISYWARLAVAPVADRSGRVVRMVCTHRDISDIIAREAELEAVMFRAEAAAAAKSEFISVISHELRTPLNGVLGFAGLLGSSPLDAKQRRAVEHISRSGMLLLDVFNNIIELTALEARRVEIDAAPLRVASLIDAATQRARAEAAAKGLRFGVELADDAPFAIVGDFARLARVLAILLGNAVKFTERGFVSLVVTVARADAGRAEIHYAVCDTGTGIPREAIATLFDAFEQADSSARRRFGGLGVGLAICRQLADLMGGDIDVQSTPGEGTTFTLRLTHILAGADAPVVAAAE
jgi:PAS domain S-box-containing protein